MSSPLVVADNGVILVDGAVVESSQLPIIRRRNVTRVDADLRKGFIAPEETLYDIVNSLRPASTVAVMTRLPSRLHFAYKVLSEDNDGVRIEIEREAPLQFGPQVVF